MDNATQRRLWVALASAVALIAHAWMNKQAAAGHPGGIGGPTTVASPLGNSSADEAAWTLPFSIEQMQKYKNDSFEMFRFGFSNYMQHAFPKDDLRPISCRGSNSQGGIALTLLDSLDALILFGDLPALREAVAWIEERPSLFDVDARVHVFEVNIRALGGLLSAHTMIEMDPSLVPGYNGTLLRAAVDLADRLMPAFDTPTGLPLSWVNLRRGQVRGDTRVTCTACAGTLLLELGMLSRLTGNPVYESKARRAVEIIWGKRSARGLVGNTINVDTGRWIRRDAGVGAGVDSFYEYLLKSYLAFGEPAYLNMFSEAYAAAQAHLALSGPINGVEWLATSHMTTGRIMNNFVSSLAAFWPGLQALAGQIEDGLRLHINWVSAWDTFKWLPESFSFNVQHMHPTMTAYPLRPELAESTFLLHAATGNPNLLQVSSRILERLRDGTKARCGHASVADAATSRLEDTMESFFLSETSKYLYLTFANASRIVDYYVMSTEGHLFPPFLPKNETELAAEGSVEVEIPSGGEEYRCKAVCEDGSTSRGAAPLQSALPLVPADPAVPGHLRRRRCIACKEVTRAFAAARDRADEIWRWNAEAANRVGRSHVAPQQWSLNKIYSGISPKKMVLCVLGDAAPGKLQCALRKLILSSQLTSQAIQAVPQNTVFFQVVNASVLPSAEAVAKSMSEVQIFKKDPEESSTSSSSSSTNCTAAGTPDGSRTCTSHETGSSSSVLPSPGGKKEGNSEQKPPDAASEDLFLFDLGLPAMLGDFGPDLLPGCNISDAESVVRSRELWTEKVAAHQAVAVGIEDDEEPSEEGESEEVVRQRIAAIERGEIVLPDTSASSTGTIGSTPHAPSGLSGTPLIDPDEDPYLDPDDDDNEDLSSSTKQPSGSRSGESSAIDEDNNDGSANCEGGDSADDDTSIGQCTNPEYVEAPPLTVTPPATPPSDPNEASSAYIDMHTACEATGPLVPVMPFTGCSQILDNAAQLSGAIGIVFRGGCSFQSKVLAAQAAGAAGVVVVNVDTIPGDGTGSSLMPMGVETLEGGVVLPQPQIPSLMVRDADGVTLMEAAARGLHGRLRSPGKERKLELAERLLEALVAKQRELKQVANDKAAADAVEAEKQAVAAAAAAVEEEKEREGSPAAAALEKENDSGPKEESETEQAQQEPTPETSKVVDQSQSSPQEKLGDVEDKPAEEVLQPPPNVVQLELVIPPNSQGWVLHQLYQARTDMTPAFTSAGLLLMDQQV